MFVWFKKNHQPVYIIIIIESFIIFHSFLCYWVNIFVLGSVRPLFWQKLAAEWRKPAETGISQFLRQSFLAVALLLCVCDAQLVNS